MPDISVIVPVYMAEPYLHRCVDSILDQSYTSFELILVNDGSSDRSGEICDEYAIRDDRIHVIHKENGGQAAARNDALDWIFEHSDSKWIHFVDSDDYIHPKLLEKLLSAMLETGAQASACAMIRTHGEPLVETNEAPVIVMNAEQYYTRDSNEASGPCAKLFTRDLLRDVRFPAGKVYEDAFTMYKLWFQCTKIAFVNWIGYAYYTNPDSTTERPWSMRRMYELEAIEEQIDFFTQKGNMRMRSFMIREYMKSLNWQLTEVNHLGQTKVACAGRKVLYKCGRRALRKYWKDRVFAGEEDMWIYARFYPGITRIYILLQTVRRKLTGYFSGIQTKE